MRTGGGDLPGFKKAADVRGSSKDADDFLSDHRRAMSDLSKDMDEQFKKESEQWIERDEATDEWVKKYGDGWKEIYDQIDSDQEKLAIKFEDVWNNAFDAWEQGGKHTARELGKYILMEIGQNAIAKIFGNIDLGSAIGTWANSLFGGFFADGGRPPMGRASIVGEDGPELFVPDSSGTVIANGALARSGMTVAPTFNYNIDARGASADLVKVLPRILQQHKESTIAEMLEGLRRRRFSI